MSPNIRIALRFLTAKKSSMAMSLACIVLGVGLFVVTQATTSGFQDYFVRTILGTDGAVRIQDRMQSSMQSIAAGDAGSPFEVEVRNGRKYIEGIDYPGQLEAMLKAFPNVSAVSEVLHGQATVRSSFKDDTIQVYGIHLEDHLRVSDLQHQIVAGSLLTFRTMPDQALLGREMADRLQLHVGDSFHLQARGVTHRYRVAAIYETGIEDVDRVRLYLNMEEARSLLMRPTGASYIQVNLFDKNRADADAPWMAGVVQHSVASWQYREKTWLQVFQALSLSTAITVSVFTLIAALAMFNTLAMIVMEKTKDIAILRSMGYERSDISRIFLWQAVIVLALGSLGGCLLGLGVTYAVSQVPLQLRGIFTTSHFIVKYSPWHYFWAVFTAVVMVMIASLLPSRRAARLEPGDVIRGTAQ